MAGTTVAETVATSTPETALLGNRHNVLLLAGAVPLGGSQSLAHFLRIGDVVAREHLCRLVAGDPHCHRLGHPALDQVACSRAAEIVKQFARTARQRARRGPGLSEL